MGELSNIILETVASLNEIDLQKVLSWSGVPHGRVHHKEATSPREVLVRKKISCYYDVLMLFYTWQ